MGAPSKKRSDAAGGSEGRAIGNFKDKVGEPEKTRWNQKRQHNNKNLEEQKGQKGFFFSQTIKNKENIWTRSCQQEWLFWGLVAKSGFWQERRRQQREKVGKRVQPASWPYLWNFYTDQKVYRKLKKKGLLSPSLSPKPGNFRSQRYHLLELQVILAYKKSYLLSFFFPVQFVWKDVKKDLTCCILQLWWIRINIAKSTTDPRVECSHQSNCF